MAGAESLDALPARLIELPPSIELSAEQRAARERARRFLQEELLPRERQFPECDHLPAEVEEHLNARARELGLWAPATPRELGGAGLGVLGAVLIKEQVAQSVLGDVRQDRGIGGDPWPALFQATDEQKQRYLYPHLRGEKRMFFALTEPAAGSDAANIQTRAEWEGRGWRINGRKHFIGAGGRADFGVVFAVTDPGKRARGGITCFIVDRETPGWRWVRDIETMGACRPAELVFEDCRVPPSNVLGEVGQGFVLAQQTLSITRIRQAALCLGTAQRAFDLLLPWLRRRVTFGRPLAQREAIRWLVARAAADLRAARLLTYSVAQQIDRGVDVRWEVPTAKTRAAQMAGRVVDLAMQLHGALGVSRDLPLERLYRDIRSMRITEGADEIQRDLIARELAGREEPVSA